ncbi:ribosome maturation factor RimM [Ahrensia kielensis]|uniref:ribosome maturation factor RimM n=1 Tax=Ahrensia kielensis TaxID=76980 RepID=UPI0004767961
MSKNDLENPVLLGVIGAAHGIKGQCRVKSYTGDPEALGDYGTLYAEDGRAFDVADIRSAKNVVVVTFKQVKDRNAAEALNGTELYVDREQLPDDMLDDDEFYVEDLIGMDVLDAAGTHIGAVMAVPNFGAGDMVEIAMLNENGGLSNKTDLYPFTKAVVPTIDMERWAITLVPPSEIIVPPEGSKEREGDPDNEGLDVEGSEE